MFNSLLKSRIFRKSCVEHFSLIFTFTLHPQVFTCIYESPSIYIYIYTIYIPRLTRRSWIAYRLPGPSALRLRAQRVNFPKRARREQKRGKRRTAGGHGGFVSVATDTRPFLAAELESAKTEDSAHFRVYDEPCRARCGTAEVPMTNERSIGYTVTVLREWSNTLPGTFFFPAL